MISVVIPVHKTNAIFPELRKLICSEINAELILISQDGFEVHDQPYSNEYRIYSDKKGRGNNFTLGLDKAKGDIVLFCHADTMLPVNWHEAVNNSMMNNSVSGGGFRLSFDRNSFWPENFDLAIRLSVLFNGGNVGRQSNIYKNGLLKSKQRGD